MRATCPAYLILIYEILKLCIPSDTEHKTVWVRSLIKNKMEDEEEEND
jgi:hypothetical protein